MDILEPNEQNSQFQKINYHQSKDGIIVHLTKKLFGSKNVTPKQVQSILLTIVVISILISIYLTVIKPLLNRPPKNQRGAQSHFNLPPPIK